MRHLKLGFTGTQLGMDKSQKEQIAKLIKELKPKEVHVGDCIGADAEFIQIVKKMDPEVWLVGHPPNIDTKRAFLEYDREEYPLAYLVRNRRIVDACSELIACPATNKEQLRSGTWSTIRYATGLGKHVYLIAGGCAPLNQDLDT